MSRYMHFHLLVIFLVRSKGRSFKYIRSNKINEELNAAASNPNGPLGMVSLVWALGKGVDQYLLF